jgi:hypothetical protein
MKIETFENTKEIMMYYHTSFRNVGLFTTLSLGALGYSRYYRGKIQYYNIVLILISFILLSISILFNLHLYTDIQGYVNENQDKDVERFLTINHIMFGVHTVLAVLCIFTLFRNTTQ